MENVDKSSSENSAKNQEKIDAKERKKILESIDVQKEIKNTHTRPLSASSTGSLPPCSEFNPFVKAAAGTRKDFNYVTNLRKEVIQIVEPYRARVLTFDDRIQKLEKIVIDMDHAHIKFKGDAE